MKVLLALLLTASLHAQTQLPNTVKVAQEWINVTVPVGAKLTAQLGCPASGATPASWSAPFTISGTVANDWYSLNLAKEPACSALGLPSLYVQQGASNVTLTVLSTPVKPVLVPALGTTTVVTPPPVIPPPTTPNTVTFPINGTCTTTYNPATNSLVLTIQ